MAYTEDRIEGLRACSLEHWYASPLYRKKILLNFSLIDITSHDIGALAEPLSSFVSVCLL